MAQVENQMCLSDQRIEFALRDISVQMHLFRQPKFPAARLYELRVPDLADNIEDEVKTRPHSSKGFKHLFQASVGPDVTKLDKAKWASCRARCRCHVVGPERQVKLVGRDISASGNRIRRHRGVRKDSSSLVHCDFKSGICLD